MSAKVSVIIPCFNDGRFLDDALSSVSCHKGFGEDIEVVLVDDGSYDQFTLEFISNLESKEDKGIKIIHQENSGLGNARNMGIRKSKGSVIIPLDADNKLTVQFLDLAIELSDATSTLHKSADIVYGKQKRFGSANSRIQPVLKEEVDSTLVHANYLDACAAYKKEVWKAVGKYDENKIIHGYEDWDFWLSAVSKGYRFKYIDSPLYYYRIRKDSLITQVKESENYKQVREYVFKKHLDIVMIEMERLRKYEYTQSLKKNNPIKYYLKKLIGRS